MSWINFIEEFTKEICTLTTSQNDTNFEYFKSSNIFGLKITLSNKYGFLELLFEDYQIADDFLALSSISKTVTFVNNTEHIKINWDISEYPCRVFIENKKLQFYDNTNDLLESEKFKNRVTVLKSLFRVLIDLKSKNAISNLS